MNLVDEMKAVKKIFNSADGVPEEYQMRVRRMMAESKPLFCRLTDAFNGTCRFFAVVFTVVGIILAFMSKLTAEYVSLVGAIQLLLTAHSVGQDYHERNSGGDGGAGSVEGAR